MSRHVTQTQPVDNVGRHAKVDTDALALDELERRKADLDAGVDEEFVSASQRKLTTELRGVSPVIAAAVAIAFDHVNGTAPSGAHDLARGARRGRRGARVGTGEAVQAGHADLSGPVIARRWRLR